MRKALIIVGKLVLALFSLSVIALLAFAGWFYWHYNYGIGLPDESRLAALPATGPACSQGDPAAYVPLAAIPPLLRKAVLAYEPDFYERPKRGPATEFAVALLSNRRPSLSPISQAVRHTCLKALSPECCKGLDWHIGNLFLMGRFERALSRDRILEIYLNEMYVGRGKYGVASAATAYFGKPLGELNVGETAFIVTCLRHASGCRRSDPEMRDFVRDHALDRMLGAGVITEAEADTAKAHPLVLKEKANSSQKQ